MEYLDRRRRFCYPFLLSQAAADEVPMDAQAGGEVPDPIVLHDEDGRAFAFRPIRALRDGADLFLLAEREGAGTLHVLAREDGRVVLVRDDAVLRRVALRLEVLRRATEGELVEWTDAEGRKRFLGVFHSGEAAGETYVLAADLDDPATVIAFAPGDEPGRNGLRPASERLRAAILEELTAATAEWTGLLPSLEAKTLGMRGERIEVMDSRGVAHAFRAAGRLFVQGRDLLFLAPDHDPERAIAFEVRPGGRIEPVADERFLAELQADLDEARRTGGAR
jgi:hypothetical protein